MRWSSTYKMLSHFLKLKLTVELFFIYLSTPVGKEEFERVKLTQPTPDQWFAITCLVRILEPFAAGVEHLSGSRYPTLTVVVPVLRHIRSVLDNDKIFDDDATAFDDPDVSTPVVAKLQQVRRAVSRLFCARFADMDSLMMWVPILDPRLSDMEHLEPEEQVRARCLALRAIMEKATQLDARGASANLRASASNASTPDKAKLRLTKAIYGRRAQRSSSTIRPNTAPLYLRCEVALRDYLRDAQMADVDVDPLAWWRANAKSHPIVARVARKWLSCVATSVSSERAFSTGGNIVTAKRCGMSPETVRDSIFIAQNSKTE